MNQKARDQGGRDPKRQTVDDKIEKTKRHHRKRQREQHEYGLDYRVDKTQHDTGDGECRE